MHLLCCISNSLTPGGQGLRSPAKHCHCLCAEQLHSSDGLS